MIYYRYENCNYINDSLTLRKQTVYIKEIFIDKTEWYLEYVIITNCLELRGDISSLVSMLSINIIMINGVENGKRSMLILSKYDDQVTRLRSILQTMDTIRLTKLRKPNLRDKLAVRHG